MSANSVLAFWDGQKFRFCPKCQALAFKFAEEYAVQFVEALEEIAEPIPFMRKRAEAEGGKLNGQMAVALSDDANFLKSIARAALKETAGQ